MNKVKISELMAQSGGGTYDRFGRQVTALGRFDIFIPVDTEAILSKDQQWAQAHKFDVLISMDGDADRPLLVDATYIPATPNCAGCSTPMAS